ncbi:putative cardiolipin-specific [Hyphodiscus hymeniophilus]|uniref:Cardiolipin-specific n=1 Tax=Hyphodiscus hymeniophilus TaxID=353542 RepID=A0A9P6VKH4_9HELO|nr:putative cardiolipin-specific [Hyphodiscus hymeniophilus]
MSASPGSNTPDRGQQPVLASQRAKTNQEAIKRGYFPLGYKAAVGQWWASISPAMAEHTVLSFIPYLQKPPTHTQTGSAPASAQQSTTSINSDPARQAAPVRTNSINDPYGPRSWHSNLVKLSGKNRALNEFSIERVGEEVEENLVMLHGYGAGLGFFYKNFEGLSRVKGWKLYALDMLGMGRSSRPPFRVHAKDQAGKIAEAENWFIDALEEWRVLKKIDKFTLLGHSMGGYMAVAYALKYPGHLNKLILASPVGIPEDPYAMQAEMPEPQDSTMANEFLQDQEEDIVQGSGNSGSKSNSKKPPFELKEAPRRPLPKWLALHNYAYSLFRQRGSGEYVLAYILAPGAFARSPLIRRINGVGRQPLPAPSATQSPTSTEVTPSTSSTSSSQKPRLTKETGIPVVMMYGENDWMDIAGGYAAEQKLKEEKAKALKNASAEERANEHGSAKVVIIQKAGHHLYLEGWEEFNEVMREEMEETKRSTRKAIENGSKKL